MKFDIAGIVNDVQKLYAKDAKSKAMITTGDTVKESYVEADGVPLPVTSPLRYLSGIPCIPFNKIAQVAGNEDVGKSTIIGEVMASAQAAGHVVILFDSEDKFDSSRFRNQFGGNPDDLILVKTNEILQGGEKVRKLILAVKTKYPDAKVLFCWDSVGGSQSRSHSERELDNEKHSQPGQDAKENGSIMKMIVSLFNKYPDSISVLLANQVYAKIGFMQVGDQASGGKKIAYHSSFIVILKRIKTLTKQVKGQKMKYGIITRAVVTKNHLCQTETSIHQMDFEITAKGASLTDASNVELDDEE